MAIIAAATTPHVQSQPIVVTKVAFGAVFPEARYLEPTIGQIWPR